MIVIQLVIEEMQLHFKLINLDLPRMKCEVESSGMLNLHDKKEINKMKDKLTNVFTCADNGPFIFNDRERMKKCCRSMCETIAKWVLTVHVGNGKKKSKTELMCFPSADTLKKRRDSLLSLP